MNGYTHRRVQDVGERFTAKRGCRELHGADRSRRLSSRSRRAIVVEADDDDSAAEAKNSLRVRHPSVTTRPHI